MEKEKEKEQDAAPWLIQGWDWRSRQWNLESKERPLLLCDPGPM